MQLRAAVETELIGESATVGRRATLQAILHQSVGGVGDMGIYGTARVRAGQELVTGRSRHR